MENNFGENMKLGQKDLNQMDLGNLKEKTRMEPKIKYTELEQKNILFNSLDLSFLF